MILLFSDGILLLFVTFHLGALSMEGLGRIFRTSLSSDMLGIFLTGLITSTIYLNIVSIWLPANYWSLLPLLLLSGWGMTRKCALYNETILSVKRSLATMQRHLFPSACLILLLFLYWIKPPTNPDSSGYHSAAIRWYESFKAVPGLGNLHGRFAFNPASFIIQAAWSLTGLTGQAIWPLNGVLTVLFLLWIFIRMLRQINSRACWAWFLLLFLFSRALLGGMSSPGSDTLVIICGAYSLIKIFESCLSGNSLTISTLAIPLLIILYAPVAKISAYPLGIVFLYVIYLLRPSVRKPVFLVTLICLALLIFVPWIVRNYILSGYLIYPLPFTGVFHADWQIPPEMLQVDYDFARYSARTITNLYPDFRYLDTAPFHEWFFRLMRFHYHVGLYPELAQLTATIFSPALWLFYRRGKHSIPRQAFVCWLAIYVCAWIWIITSMDYRFGLIFLILPYFLPLLLLTRRNEKQQVTGKLAQLPFPLAMSLFVIYYSYGDFHLYKRYATIRRKAVHPEEGWIYPLKEAERYIDNNKADFPYQLLGTGQKLYQEDATHNCLNADFPCQYCDYGWKTGIIEMRGKRLDQGFKNVGIGPIQDERPISFP